MSNIFFRFSDLEILPFVFDSFHELLEALFTTDVSEKGKLQNSIDGIVFQFDIKGQRFKAASFMAGLSDEMVREVSFFVPIVSKTFPKKVFIFELEWLGSQDMFG
jgi:hypothetical protein